MLQLWMLKSTCNAALIWRPKELAEHLQPIVSVLVPLASQNSTRPHHPGCQTQALSILELLLNQEDPDMCDAVTRLDAIPAQPPLSNLHVMQKRMKLANNDCSLVKHIEDFLQPHTWSSWPESRLEGVLTLAGQLAQGQRDVAELLRKDLEHPEEGVLLQLFTSLLSLGKAALHCSASTSMIEAVGRCLGELGPLNLATTTLSLKMWQEQAGVTDAGSSPTLRSCLSNISGSWSDEQLIHHQNQHVLELLNVGLTDSSMLVRSAAANCLRAVLATTAGEATWSSRLNKRLPSNDPLLKFLIPFRGSRKQLKSSKETDSKNIDHAQKPREEAYPQGRSWLQREAMHMISSGWIQDRILQLLAPICEASHDLCVHLFPYLLRDVLIKDTNGSHCHLISDQFSSVFKRCSPQRSLNVSLLMQPPAVTEKEDRDALHSTVRSLLYALNFLRQQNRSESETPWDNNFWLDLDLLQVAWSAQDCGAHFTALLYTEIHVASLSSTVPALTESSNLEDSVKVEQDETNPAVQELLLQIYRSIGEPDGLMACGADLKDKPMARVCTYQQMGSWERVLSALELESELPEVVRQSAILQALQQCGLSSVMDLCLRGLDHLKDSEELRELRFQAAWRCGQWDSLPAERVGHGFHEGVLQSLQAIEDRDFKTAKQILASTRVGELSTLCTKSLESVHTLYPTLAKLQALNEAEDMIAVFNSSPSDELIHKLCTDWSRRLDLLQGSNFWMQEQVLSLRSALLREALKIVPGNSTAHNLFNAGLLDCLAETAQQARLAGHCQLSLRAVQAARQCGSLLFDTPGALAWQLEEAQAHWAQQEPAFALRLLKDLLDKLSNGVEGQGTCCGLYAKCLRLYGEWQFDSCAQRPATILSQYLQKSVRMAEQAPSGDLGPGGLAEVHLALGRFADRRYRELVKYMCSAEFETKRSLLCQAKHKVNLHKEHRVNPSRYTMRLQKESELDEKEVTRLEEGQAEALSQAVVGYLSSLRAGTPHDAPVFRLASLWLDNATDPEITAKVQEGLLNVPSHRLIPLIYQLAARMGSSENICNTFHDALKHVILRTTLQHPHHCLLVVLALVNANRDELLLKPIRGRQSSRSVPRDAVTEERMKEAKEVLEKVRAQHPVLVREAEQLCDAYISLANYDARKMRQNR
uniref:serine-protein kinase ATM-like n=1 Tax=Myxine glutinosa TaxID=7769 RepID=UPI00358DFD47